MTIVALGAPASAVSDGTDDGLGPVPWSSEGQFLELIDEWQEAAADAAADPRLVEVVVGLQGRSLAAEQAYRGSAGLSPLRGAGERQYVASLARSQEGLQTYLQAHGAHIVSSYRIVFNGIAAFVPLDLVPNLRTFPGVMSVERTVAFEPALDFSVDFILGGQTYASLGSDGTGVTISIIDTGIDYTHASLGGSGIVADYTSNDPTWIEPGTFPTAKVVDGWDFVGEWYDAGCPPVPPVPGVCSSIPMPDPDPLDRGGHGSHVSGIAAGMGASGVPHGVAPGATLLAMKLFALGSVSSSIVAAALERSADPNGDGDTSDHADVVNMSLGSSYGRNTELGAVASNAAVDVGIIVVASAGNSGNLPYIHGAPAAADKAISVAAGNDPGITVQLAMVSGSNGADGSYESLEGAITVPLTISGARSGFTTFVGEACSALPAGSLAGMVPLIARGTCTFQAKLVNVGSAGAVAAVVYNNVAGAGPIVMGGSSAGVTIPGVMVGNANGLAVRAAIDADTTITLDPANRLPIPDRLQSFTSRGPRFSDNALKPDVTAPGGSVLSVRVGSGTGATSLSGTSMSSPHVAGSAAILRALHPTWTVEEIKSLLMNTATDASPGGGVPYPVSLMGAGRVRVDVAAESESVAVPGSASLRAVESSTIGTKSYATKIEVRNKGTETKTYSLSSAFAFANDDEGSIQVLHPSSLTVRAGQKRSFELRLVIDFNALAPESSFEEYDGFLIVVETTTTAHRDLIHVPFHVIPYARAWAHVNGDSVVTGGIVSVANDGLRSTSVDVYQFGTADPNENLIAEPPGFPEDPDSWFDIRRVGAKTYTQAPLGQILEFAVLTHGLRTNANMLRTQVYLDLDEDGTADFVATGQDLGRYSTPPFFDGRIASAITHIPSNTRILEFIVADPFNTAVQTLPVRLSSLNSLAASRGGPSLNAANPDFDYWVVTSDPFESGASDTTRPSSFNAITPVVTATPHRFTLAAGASEPVTATGEGRLLFVYANNVAGPNQSEVVLVHA